MYVMGMDMHQVLRRSSRSEEDPLQSSGAERVMSGPSMEGDALFGGGTGCRETHQPCSTTASGVLGLTDGWFFSQSQFIICITTMPLAAICSACKHVRPHLELLRE